MTRLTAPAICSSVISNFEDDDQSTSEYNGSSTLTPSTTHNGVDSNATTISSQTSLNDYNPSEFNQSSHQTNLNNNNLTGNHHHHIDNGNNRYGQQQQDSDEISSRQQPANYYGVNDLKEASWRRQANTSGAITCDFYGGSGKPTNSRDQHHLINDSSNVTNASRFGSQTSVNNDRLVHTHQAVIHANKTISTVNANVHVSNTHTSSNTMGCCGDSLDDVSGTFDQMSIQSELIASSLARQHYDNQDNSKYFESLSARASFKPSNVIMHQHQPTTTLPKPARVRGSPQLTRTYSMIGQSRRGHSNQDRSMTLNRHERRFMTRNIASVLSKPRAPPTIPSIPQLNPTLTSSPLSQNDEGEPNNTMFGSSHRDYQANTSQDEYADAKDSSFMSCSSQPSSLDNSSVEKKKHNSALSNLGSRITLATKGKTVQNQIANIKKFFSSIPKRKSFIGSNRKTSLFDTPDGDMFLNKRCPSGEALPNSETVRSMRSGNLDRGCMFSSSCSQQESGVECKSYNPRFHSRGPSDTQDRISINSNSSRLNYTKDLHTQSGECVINQNIRKSWTPEAVCVRDRRPIQHGDSIANNIRRSNDISLNDPIYGRNVASHDSYDSASRQIINVVPIAPSFTSSGPWMSSNLINNHIAASNASLTSSATVEIATNPKKDKDIGTHHMAVVAPRSNSCSSRLSSIYAPTALSSLPGSKINSSQQRKTLPPPPPPPPAFQLQDSSKRGTIETNLDIYGYDSVPLPPPPSDLRVLSYSPAEFESDKFDKHENSLHKPLSGSDGDERSDEETNRSWQMSSLPIFQERKLTTVYEENPRKYQRTQPMSESPSHYQCRLPQIDTSLGQYIDNGSKPLYQLSSRCFMNGNKEYNRTEENTTQSEKIEGHNLSSELDADTTLVSNILDSSHEKKDCQKLANKITELELKLQSKEKSFTNLQLEQLSAAYLVDQLRSTIEKLEQENSHLKATLNRYHQIQPGHAGFNGPLKINQG